MLEVFTSLRIPMSTAEGAHALIAEPYQQSMENGGTSADVEVSTHIALQEIFVRQDEMGMFPCLLQLF